MRFAQMFMFGMAPTLIGAVMLVGSDGVSSVEVLESCDGLCLTICRCHQKPVGFIA